jgi:uncharacterized protein YndB with AHSA1/START domain
VNRPGASGAGRRILGENMSEVEPIVVSIDLAATPVRAFAAFTAQFADWWPVATHSLSRQAQARCRLEAAPGGALEERAPDGARHRWGTVESVDPGRRIRFTWHPGRGPDTGQWIEVEFSPRGTGSRVTLIHGGWDALGEIAPILRREYVSGWQNVFGKVFAEFADARE